MRHRQNLYQPENRRIDRRRGQTGIIPGAQHEHSLAELHLKYETDEKYPLQINSPAQLTNDINDWAIETMQNPRYPLELFQRVITVSLETMKIVKALPPLDI